MTKSRLIASVVVALLIAMAIAGFAIARRAAISAIEPPAPQSFDSTLVQRGRVLAAIGNCASCHTVRGGRDFAGGLPVPTPFGTIFSSNITPDAETGIGRWPETAFTRAMRAGVDRDGRHLYPTFPYDHFTHVTDEDDRALYAYLMTRPPVHAPGRANQLPFPLDQRVVIAGWKLLFLHRGAYQPDPGQNGQWNRGAYLVEGLAHCGACHTPRNALGAERGSARFAGGDADHWDAYAINAQSPAPVPWDAEALFAYLRNGWQGDHGVARGPMAEVVANLSDVPDDDIRAIATYMADVFGAPTPEHQRRADQVLAQVKAPAVTAPNSNAAGAAIYAAACTNCHESKRPLPYGGVNLHLSTAISAPDSRNAANTVLTGIRAVEGSRSPIMPGFTDSMTDAQIVALLNYLRARLSDRPAWTGLEETVADARRTQAAFLKISSGPQNAPLDASQRDKP